MIDNGGAGYTSANPPTVTITGGGGTGATGAAVVNSSGVVTGISFTGVLSIDLINAGGSGYSNTSPPAVTISGGGGSGATATAVVTNGIVTGIIVNNPGSGYTSIPTVTIAAPGGTHDGEGRGDARLGRLGLHLAPDHHDRAPTARSGPSHSLCGGQHRRLPLDRRRPDLEALPLKRHQPRWVAPERRLSAQRQGHRPRPVDRRREPDDRGERDAPRRQQPADGHDRRRGRVRDPARADDFPNSATQPNILGLDPSSFSGIVNGSNVTNVANPLIDGYTEQSSSGSEVYVSLYDMSNPSTPVLIGGYNPATEATATATINTLSGALTSINVTNGGSGYTTAPTVVLTGGGSGTGFSPATATAILTGGTVTSIIFSGGAGYTYAPTVSIALPPPSGNVTTNASGQFSIPINAGYFTTNGTKTIGIQATDAAGEIGNMQLLNFVLDTHAAGAPTALDPVSETGTFKNDNITNDNNSTTKPSNAPVFDVTRSRPAPPCSCTARRSTQTAPRFCADSDSNSADQAVAWLPGSRSPAAAATTRARPESRSPAAAAAALRPSLP